MILTNNSNIFKLVDVTVELFFQRIPDDIWGSRDPGTCDEVPRLPNFSILLAR